MRSGDCANHARRGAEAPGERSHASAVTVQDPRPELPPQSQVAPLSIGEREQLRRGSGSRVPLGLVLLALAFAIALPRLTERRIARLRDEINNVAIPARQLVAQIPTELALEAAQRRGYLLTGDPLATDQIADSRSRRLQAEIRLIELARRLDAGGRDALTRAAETLRHLDQDLDSLVVAQASRSVSSAALREQRRRFLVVESLADSLDRSIEDAASSRRRAIAATESTVSLLTGVSLLLGLGAAFMVARLGSRFRTMALRLDESERGARLIAESERAARAVAEHREQELERVTESRGRLIRGFTHDVKNPLGAANGFLALVDEGVYGEIGDKAREIITKVRRSIGQALELIAQMLEIARAEAGELVIRREQIDLAALLRDVVDSFGAQASAKEIAVTLEPPEDLPRVHTDDSRVRQVAGNLVSNAVKYTPRGGHVRVSARLSTDVDRNGRSSVVIEVADDGPGIPRDKLPLLFTEFTRFDPGAAEGSGIGLAISQKVATALGGSIGVSSSDGAGSTFSFHLPVGDRRA
jgi:signal transduction histidine kinase